MSRIILKRLCYIIFICCCVVLISCSEDTERGVEHSNERDNSAIVYQGKITMSDGFEQNSVKVDITYLNDSLMTIRLFQVRFAENMPISIDMEWRKLAYTTNDNKQIFSADSIIPFTLGGYLEAFTCYNVNGYTDNDSLIFSFYCKGETASFYGVKQP